MNRLQPTFLFAVWSAVVVTQTYAQDPPPSEKVVLKSRIIDHASLFAKSVVDQQTLVLQSLERTSGVPTVVETILTLKGDDLEDSANQAAKAVGNNGIFLLIAKGERRISQPIVDPKSAPRITEVERGRLHDAVLRGFKAGNPDQGLKDGVVELAAILNKDFVRTATGSPLITRNRINLTLGGAKKILNAAEARANEMGLKMNIAVVDDGGHLMAFVRMDGGRPASVATAQTKAISAATFHQATGPLPANGTVDLLLSLSVPSAAAAGGARITPLLGGLPIEVEGQIIGGVGVGGGTGQQDAEVARAGIQAFVEELEAASKNK